MVYVQGIWGVDEVHQVYFEDLENSLIPQVDISITKEGSDNAQNHSPATVLANQFELYPLPASTEVFLHWSSTLDRNLQYRIMDASGRLVKTGQIQGNIDKTSISVESLSEGTYVLMLNDKKETYIEKRILLVMRNE